MALRLNSTSEFLKNKFIAAKRSTAVVLGFAALLALMGALVVDSMRQIGRVSAGTSRLRQEYRERGALLDELRKSIYQASGAMSDVVLSPAGNSGGARAELESIRRRNDATLARYLQLALPDERQAVLAFRNLEDSYIATILSAIDPGAARGPTAPLDFLRTSVLPNRNRLLDLITQIDAMDDRDTNAGEERIQTLQSEFQRRVENISISAFLIAAVLAISVIVRHQYLERQAARNFDQVQAAKRDLSLLSNRLVAAQEEERRRLSRDLHDEVGQSMTAILIDLGRLESRLPDSGVCRQILAGIRRAAEETVARVRDLALLLRPSILDELGLLPALRWQTREVARRSGLKVKLIADEFDEDLPDEHLTCVYRIVQEALHNCVKHSKAGEARVFVTREPTALLVSIQDNGVGFDPAQQKGLGLLGLGERAAQLGGVLQIDSHTGGGTVLSVRLPLPVLAEPAAAGAS